MASGNTFAALISNFGDFLTVAVHTILYERQIYPLTTFITAKKWNYPVRQSRHPKVCQWINDAVSAVQDELMKGTVDRVALVIYSQYNRPLERFMFDLSKFPVVSKEDFHTPIERASFAAPANETSTCATRTVDMEEQFRAVMARLSSCRNTLAPIPKNCTYTLAIELKDTADPPLGHPQPWIPMQPSLQKEVGRLGDRVDATGKGSDLGGVNTTPVRSVDAGEMVFEMWIEEGVSKETAMENEVPSQESG